MLHWGYYEQRGQVFLDTNLKLFILLNNQRDAGLSSCIYSSLQDYSTCFIQKYI
jgi:hypothetical protein